MEQLTTSLTQQANEKDTEISKLRSTVTEKDLEMAQALREFDENQDKLKQSLIEEQQKAGDANAQINALMEQ